MQNLTDACKDAGIYQSLPLYLLPALLQVFFSILEETTHLQMGLDLLQVIKNDLGLAPSRKVLDALLSACVSTKDLDKSLLIWKEYQAADLPYNILSFLR